jgi:16S rRNA A1518/A1519 N6-dimethyltransferase RsmA/KsgA/DIM1 with predicted DNA glycosylase/AP lyase activity
VRALARDAFAHRRKTLVRSLALAMSTSREHVARAARGALSYDGDAVRAALVELGHPADVRAERLSPGDFHALAQVLARRTSQA